MSTVSSKKRLSRKSAAHLKDGIDKLSLKNDQLGNIGCKLLLLPVYGERRVCDERRFYSEALDIYELHCGEVVVKHYANSNDNFVM